MEFHQLSWDRELEADWEQLLRLAVHEDLGTEGDRTTQIMVPAEAQGRAAVVARGPGMVAGLAAVETTLHAFDAALGWEPLVDDGQAVAAGQPLGRISGPARGLLSAERTLLNLLGRLSGIATLTQRYVAAVAGTHARIYDTRKTTPGWRRLEKYAVRCGGGWNHRTGLYEAVLIKDNHLALAAQLASGSVTGCRTTPYTPAEAVVRVRQALRDTPEVPGTPHVIIEIEVDTLEQFDAVLAVEPDLILLDNMGPAVLREAVARRDARRPRIELEASGGVDLRTVRAIAETGVERISVGALTHSAVALDIALDWLSSPLPLRERAG